MARRMKATTACPTFLKGQEEERFIENLFHDAGVAVASGNNSDESEGSGKPTLQTKSGWCLMEGIFQLVQASNTKSLVPLIEQHGLPGFYSCLQNKHPSRNSAKPRRHAATENIKDPSTCFQSLCRIIAGQFVSGVSAQAAWNRLVQTTGNELTPAKILELVADRRSNQGQNIEIGLQKPAGLTRAKAASIVDLAHHFDSGKITDHFLESAPEDDVRQALLGVRGIGPWSCDMFLMFYLERSNILPLGDLGVRKGLSVHFGIKGDGSKQQICPRKDVQRVRDLLQSYEPYLSLVSYYMWRVCDTPLPVETDGEEDRATTELETPLKKRRKIKNIVTPL